MRLLLAPTVAVALAAAPSAEARPTVDACVDAHTEAQVLRRESRFREAKEKLRVCVNESCPAIARKDCATWLDEVEREQPTVVVVASGVTEGAVLVDGEPVGALDGKAVPVDPGRHVFRVESGERAREVALLVATGDRNRRVELDFRPAAAPPAPAAPERTSGPPALTYVLGGVALGAFGSFGGFALAGKDDERCVPACSRDQIDDFRRSYLVADVSLGIGLVAAAGALWLALASR